jgi:hypothetical protein
VTNFKQLYLSLKKKVRFEKNLATHHDLADAAYLSKARNMEAAVKDESKVTQIINLICEEFPKTVFCFLKTCLLGLIHPLPLHWQNYGAPNYPVFSSLLSLHPS